MGGSLIRQVTTPLSRSIITASSTFEVGQSGGGLREGERGGEEAGGYRREGGRGGQERGEQGGRERGEWGREEKGREARE